MKQIIDTNPIPIITIDGPSGTGKGTISQKLAHYLGWHYLDSGALYRVLACTALSRGLNLTEPDALVQLAHQLHLQFKVDDELNTQVFADGQDITAVIRTESCGQNASKIAAIPEVRAALLARQRSFSESPGLVTDGRDMGSVVFPNATLKLFLVASPEERANRRLLQLKNTRNGVTLAHVIDQLTERDARDRDRACSPLKPADDAIQVDTTGLFIDQVFAKVLFLVKRKGILEV